MKKLIEIVYDLSVEAIQLRLLRCAMLFRLLPLGIT